MEKINQERSEVLKAVLAFFKKSQDENARITKRIFELVQLPQIPLMPQMPDNSIEQTGSEELFRSIAEIYADRLIGIISEEEFWSQIKIKIKGYTIEKMTGLQMSEGVPTDIIRKTTDDLIDEILTFFIPPDFCQKSVLLFRHLFEIADRENIAPDDVFKSDVLYKELVRMTYTLEEYKSRLNKIMDSFNPEKLREKMIKPIIDALGLPKEDADGIYKEYTEQTKQDPAIQEMIKKLKRAAAQVLEEESKRCWG